MDVAASTDQSPRSQHGNCSEEWAAADHLLELKWAEFQSTLASAFSHLRLTEDLVDVTLVSGAQRSSAHKLVLCAASPWFKTLLTENPCKHPIIILHENYQQHLSSILDFIYSGCVRVARHSLPQFLQLAHYLQIKGLDSNDNDIESTSGSLPPTRRKHRLPPDHGDQSGENKSVRISGPDVIDRNVPSPDSQLPYTLLEPKLEISDNPVEYSHYGETELMDSHPHRSCKQEEQTSNYNSKQCTSHYTSSHQNSLQDLMNITGRLEDMQTKKFSKSSIEPGTAMCTTSNAGFVERAPHYAPSPYFSSMSQDMSVVPYVPNQHDPSSGPLVPVPSVPLHSLDARFCHLCGKHYSNSSNLKQHIRLIHTSGSLLCPLCRKSFRNKLYLRRHVMSYHECA